jgi:hypothetical protein
LQSSVRIHEENQGFATRTSLASSSGAPFDLSRRIVAAYVVAREALCCGVTLLDGFFPKTLPLISMATIVCLYTCPRRICGFGYGLGLR